MYKQFYLYAVSSIILVSSISGCATSAAHHDAWFGKDKFYHFTAAAAIGAGSTAIAKNSGMPESDAAIIGVSVAVGAGAGKELYDQQIKETFWSWKDMFWNVVGGMTGSFAVSRF
jgi:putative lipoprotein